MDVRGWQNMDSGAPDVAEIYVREEMVP